MSLEAILIWIVIGAVAGWLASVVMKGGSFGLLGNIVLGIIGAFVGGWLLGLLGVAFGGILGSIVTAFIGAVVLIFLARLIKRA
ncbi:MAG: GlsB/YeaQ/YmgE family stress response membrane protein [Pseudomonadota bacterium]